MAQIVDIAPDPALEKLKDAAPARERLAGYVSGLVDSWASDRDGDGRKERWEEYYRLWRGIWSTEDRNRNSERSRIITPALQQAIEAVTSEIESAILDKAQWFDVEDDITDQSREDILALRATLREDMDEAQFQQAMNQIFLNGSIFGTGIGKIIVDEVDVMDVRQGRVSVELTTDTKVLVKLMPVMPQEFAIDPAAHSIADAFGVAHIYSTPNHIVTSLQRSGTYYSCDVGSAMPEDPLESDESPASDASAVNLIEYNGLVPRALLKAARDEADLERAGADDEDEIEDILQDGTNTDEDDDLVEAIIVIGNGKLLKAVENPTLTKERLFVAYRHEIVPNQFWGRGVAEKGYNSQKALDASMRARIDGLALTVHPMMGIDSTRIPRGFRFAIAPGRSILTTGNPDEVLRPVKFGNMDPNQFTQTSELERMVSMSTGGFDTAAPVSVNNRNETASGMSMMLGGFVKRSKRTIRNIENEFIIPLVKQVARLYMQFAPDRYPARDVTFKAMSVLGTMARELEQNQFASMLSTVPQDSPAFWMLLRSVYEHSQLSNREDMVKLIDAQLQTAMNPPPPPPDPLIELRRLEVMGKLRTESARIQVEYIRAQAEIARAANDARLAQSKEAKLEADAILSLAKAAAEEIGNQWAMYNAQLKQLESEAASDNLGLAENVIKIASTTGLGVNSGNPQLDGGQVAAGGMGQLP